MSDILRKICRDKADWVEAQKSRLPLVELQAKLSEAPKPRGFYAKLQQDSHAQKFAIIAEVKKASPSKGLIRADFDPKALAKMYESAGASCVSVLTDQPYFQGSDQDFLAARHAIDLPMIRKDFIVDSYQIDETRSLGSDCVLLILAALSDDLTQELWDRATQLGMDVLLEVHNEEELERALSINSHGKETLIGVNNRNLKTLEVDLNTSINLAPKLDRSIWVAESGISQPTEISRLVQAGAKAFLIGESFMRQADPKVALENLLHKASQ